MSTDREEHPDFVAAVYVALGIAVVLTTAFGLLGARLFAKVLAIPQPILLCAIAMLCVIGSYAANNSLFDVVVMIGFGVLGYLMQELGFPVVPLVFGLILGPMLEENVRRTLVVSDGSWLIYVQRPISVALLGLAVLTAAYPVFLEYRARRRFRGHLPPPSQPV